MHKFLYREGRLFCEDVALEEVSRQVGTPVYVYSANTMRENFRRLARAFSSIEHMICFAVKANSNLAVLKLLAEEGAGFDIVSAGELHRVVRAGGQPSQATFAGVGKTEEEIELALRSRVYSINVESEPELERIGAVASALGIRAPIAVRINPDVDAGTHEFISTGKSKNKFGIGYDRALEVYERAAAMPNLQIRGVQTHIGSQILETAPFAQAVGKLSPIIQTLKTRYAIEFFSIGGGMGIVYKDALASGSPEWWRSPERQTPITPESYATTLLPMLEPLGLRILLEPGRFIVGNAGALITTVQYVKSTPQKTFVITDAAMNDLIRPALYDGWHEIVPIRHSGNHLPLREVDIVGPVCESGDFLAKGREMGGVESGCQLAVLSAGAYGAVMASNYNSRPLVPEVLVDRDSWRVVRRRQTLDEMLATENP